MANGLQITPIRIHFSNDQSIETLRLTNQSDEPIVVQLDVKTWDQQEGEDIYNATSDLLVTPPLFTIPPQKTQVVRVALLKPRDPLREKAYRLIVREVAGNKSFHGLRMILEMRLPIFVDPLQAGQPAYTAAIRALTNKEYEISVANVGTHHILVKEVILLDKRKGSTLSQAPPLAYVFPGKTKTFLLKSDKPLSPLVDLAVEIKK